MPTRFRPTPAGQQFFEVQVVRLKKMPGDVTNVLYMVRKSDKQKQQECRDKVYQASGFLLELVNSVLDRNELEAGTVELAHKPFAEKWGQIDVILMDVMVPVMGGLEAAKAVRAMARPAAAIPIFAMTANAFQDDVRQSFAAGMNEHLAKPLQEGEVLAVIRRYTGAGHKKEEKT